MDRIFRNVAGALFALAFIILAAWLLKEGIATPNVVWLKPFWTAASVVAAVGCVASLAAYTLRRLHGVRAKAESLRLIGSFIIFFFCTGALLFSTAFIMAYPAMTAAEGFLRSMMCSFKLFGLDVNGFVFSKLAGPEGAHLKALITAQSVFSFSCTVLLFLGLIAERLKAHLRLRIAASPLSRPRDCFIIFGINDRSEALARDIRRKLGDSAEIIFIVKAKIDNSEGHQWGKFVGMFTHRREYFKAARSIGAHVELASADLHEIDPASAQGRIMHRAGISFASRIAKRALAAGHNATFIFCGHDPDATLRSIIALSTDSFFNRPDADAPDAQNYPLIIYNTGNIKSKGMLADIGRTRHIHLRAISDASLAVDALKLDAAFHPASFLPPQTTDEQSVSPFTAIVAGFGATGCEALRFLYEFGAFADADGNRSPFRCIVADRDLQLRADEFRAAAPEAAAAKNPDGSPLIDFRQTDVFGLEFQRDIIPSVAPRLNYAVIALADDYDSMRLAASIAEATAIAGRSSGLKIAVRCINPDRLEYMHRIADHYNRLLGGSSPAEMISIFGQVDSIYTYNNVVADRIEKMGRRFYDNYSRCQTVMNQSVAETWDARRFRLSTKSPGETGAQALANLRQLKRKEAQDIANSLHIATKIVMLRRLLGLPDSTPLADLADEISRLPDAKSMLLTSPDSSTLSLHEKILWQLAKLEHTRWTAALQLLGYSRGPLDIHTVDDLRRYHNCLVSWQQLDLESKLNGLNYKDFDLMVVLSSIEIFRALTNLQQTKER